MNAITITNPDVINFANLHLTKQYNRKKQPHEKNLYGIPLDQPVGTKAFWYKKNPPSGYISYEQKKYWGRNISVCQILPGDALAELGKQDGAVPTFLVTITKF